MARITESGPSNNPEERWDALRLGTSSSTSERMPARSGTSGTTDLPSPVPDAENPFSRGQPARPLFSSVDLTVGSGLGTTFSPLSPSGSSEDSAPPKEATPALDPEADLDHRQLMEMARESYQNSNYEEADRLLELAENRGASAVAVASARGYVAEARARALAASPPREAPSGAGPSEEDPAVGGMIVP